MRFDAIIKKPGAINKFKEMGTAPSDPTKQFVVRMNRETFYSNGVLDMEGIDLTIPETENMFQLKLLTKIMTLN